MGIDINLMNDDDISFSQIKEDIDRRNKQRYQQEFSSLSEVVGEEQSSSSWSKRARYHSIK